MTTLDLLRKPHRIEPRAAIRIFPLTLCGFCGVRVHKLRNGTYRHDRDAIRALVRGDAE